MKTYLVTGCNRGVGLALAAKLVSICDPTEGDLVFACSRRLSDDLQEVLKNPCAKHIELEITSDESVDNAFREVENLVGENGLNLLVNNAGIVTRVDTPSNMTTEDLMHNINVNVIGTHRVTQKFAPLLEKAASKNDQEEVGWNRALCFNISSDLASIQDIKFGTFFPSYRVSKAALNMLVRCTAVEMIEKNVLFVSAHPGWVQTDMGGPDAPIPVSQCADDMMGIIQKVGKGHSGLFLQKDAELMNF